MDWDWGPWMLLLGGSILLAWLLFLVPWRKSGVALWDNYGACLYGKCGVMAYRCTGHCCGACCRRAHGAWEKHIPAPPLTGTIVRQNDGPAHTQPSPNSTERVLAAVAAEVVDSKLPVRYGGKDNKNVSEEPVKKEDVKPPTPGEMVPLDDAGKLVDFTSTYSWQPKVFD